MRKWLVLLGVVVIGTWLVLWIGAGVMGRLYTTGGEHAWPMGLGTLADARKRYPPAPASPPAYKLIDKSATLGVDIAPRNQIAPPLVSPRANPQLREAITKYVNSQIERATPEIESPPAAVAEYLAAHGGDFASVRSLLLGDEQVTWNVDYGSHRAPLPNFAGHLFLARLLLANALDRARHGDAGAWEDARAAVGLSRGLWERPELISALIGLAIDRNVNAVARKLPLPAPAWFGEFQKFDYTRAMLAARQAESWAISDAIHAETGADESLSAGHRRAIDTVLSPYVRLCTADSLDADRLMALEVAASRTCDIDQWAFARRKREALAWWNVPGRKLTWPSLDAVWRRLFRFRAELEATERALRLRGGQPPPSEPACSDGQWIYDANGFRFSRKIDMPRPAMPIPLEFSVPQVATQ